MKKSLIGLAFAAAVATSAIMPAGAMAADWSVTEVQYQLGRLANPFLDTKETTNVITLQHASGHAFGDVFFFIDLIDDARTDGFNDQDAYGELYSYWSSSKIFGRKYSGPIKDIGAVAGVNVGMDANYRTYMAGGYIDWNVPGFAFFRTHLVSMIDDSSFHADDGWQFDTTWAYPFQVGGQRFSFEGHLEYTAVGDNDFGKQNDWFLAQPQLRWDAGYAFTGKKDVFFVGTEYQGWVNKLGSGVNESAFQALAVWRF